MKEKTLKDINLLIGMLCLLVSVISPALSLIGITISWLRSDWLFYIGIINIAVYEAVSRFGALESEVEDLKDRMKYLEEKDLSN